MKIINSFSDSISKKNTGMLKQKSFLKKSIYAVFFILFVPISSFACKLCKQQQPKILRGISHGAGPTSNWDYIFVGITAVIVVLTLFYSIKWIIKPGENSDSHIKRLFID